MRNLRKLTNPSRDTLTRCGPLLTLPMGATLSPDLVTRPSECGMRKLDPQSASLLRGTLTRCHPLLNYSPDGRYIISGSSDKTIRIWDAETGSSIGKPLEAHTDSVWSVACSPEGRHIISGSSDKTIRIWDANTGSDKPLEGHAR